MYESMLGYSFRRQHDLEIGWIPIRVAEINVIPRLVWYLTVTQDQWKKDGYSLHRLITRSGYAPSFVRAIRDQTIMRRTFVFIRWDKLSHYDRRGDLVLAHHRALIFQTRTDAKLALKELGIAAVMES